MELSEFGRRRKAVVVSLATIPILAGTAGAGWAALQPAEYRHSVDLQVPAPSDQAGAAALEQNVSTYRSLVNSAQVVDVVVHQTGVEASKVRDGLSTQRTQQGSQRGALVRIVYVGTTASTAPQVSRAAAIAAAEELMRPALDAAKREVIGAEAAAGSARVALVAASKKYGGLPTEEYRSLQNQISQLESERDAPSGRRSIAEVDEAIKTRKKQLATLASQAIEVQSLDDLISQANRQLADAQRAVRDAETRMESAKASLVPTSRTAQPVGRTPMILRTMALCTGSGVLAAVAILVLAELLRRRPRPPAPPAPPREQSTSGDEPPETAAPSLELVDRTANEQEPAEYRLEAVIAPEKLLKKVTNGASAHMVSLPMGLALIPLTETVVAGLMAPGRLDRSLAQWSFHGPVAYVEAEYFGGAGQQMAAVWHNGAVALGPLLRAGDDPTPPEGGPIDQALALLGVVKDGYRDEFEAVGLGRYRSTEEWTWPLPTSA